MSDFESVTKGLNNLGSLLDDLKAKSFTRNSSAPSLLPRIGQGSSSGSLSHLGRLRRATERPRGGPLSGNESSSSRLGQGGAAFTLSSPQPSTDDLAPSSSVTSFTTKRGVVRQHYVLVRHLRTILEYFVSKVTEGGGSGSSVTVSTLTSHQVREYVVANRIFPPEDKALGQYFTSNFPTPDVVVTYTWSSPLEVVCTALEAALSRIEFQTFTVWLDIFCLHQYHRDMNKELIAAQTLYASAQRHLVATTPGQGLGVLTRAWCCFELAIRMKGLGFASPPQLIASTASASPSTSQVPPSRDLKTGPSASLPRQTSKLGSRSLLGMIAARASITATALLPSLVPSADSGGSGSRGAGGTNVPLPPPFDPAEQLARMLAGQQGGQPSFMSLMAATIPEDLLVIKAEVMRVFRNPETFDELLLGFVEADEVSWLASHLPDMPLSARSPVRQQVVQWIVTAFKTQLPRVDPDLVVMAVLLDLEQKSQTHLIITRIQHMVHRGQSAFDWRHLSLGQDIKRAAAAEIKMAAKVKLAMDGTDPITTKLRNRRNCRQVWKLFLARALT